MATKFKLFVVAALAISAFASEEGQLKNAELHKSTVMAPSTDTLLAQLMERVEKLEQKEREQKAIELNHDGRFEAVEEARELEIETKHSLTLRFTCAAVANKYEQKTHTEAILCHDAKAAGADPPCCKESSCCVDHSMCSLAEVFGALNMTCSDDAGGGEELLEEGKPARHKGLVRKEPRWTRTVIDAQGGLIDAQGSQGGVLDTEGGVIDAQGALMKRAKLHQGAASRKSEQPGSAEEGERLLQQKNERLTRQVHEQEVEDSLATNGTLGGILEVRGHIKRMKEMHSEIPLYSRDVGNLDPVTFQDSLAGFGADILSGVLQGGEPDFTDVAALGLNLVASVNPILGVFAGVFAGLLGGDPTEELIKYILAEVDKKVNKNFRRVLANGLKDMAEELEWVPGMLTNDTTLAQTELSYFLGVQHDLATKRTNVFHEVCIAKKPWDDLTEEDEETEEERDEWKRKKKRSKKRKSLIDETSDTVTSESTQLDESMRRKGGGEGRDECDKWLEDGRTKEIMWTYSMTQLSVLSTIVQLRPSFRQQVGVRVKKLAREYAGLLKSAYEKSFIPYRIGQIEEFKWSQVGGKGWSQVTRGYNDHFLGTGIVRVTRTTESPRRPLTSEGKPKPDPYKDYRDGIQQQLVDEKRKRVSKLLLWAKTGGQDRKCPLNYTFTKMDLTNEKEQVRGEVDSSAACAAFCDKDTSCKGYEWNALGKKKDCKTKWSFKASWPVAQSKDWYSCIRQR